MKTNITTEITINYQPTTPTSKLIKINSSIEVVDYLRKVWSNYMNYKEEAYILLLNRTNRILGYSKLSSGSTTGTIVEVKMILQLALKANASSIILAHNHPSGNTEPSIQDIELTKKLKASAKLMDIDFLDHLIMTSENYYSFADKGII